MISALRIARSARLRVKRHSPGHNGELTTIARIDPAHGGTTAFPEVDVPDVDAWCGSIAEEFGLLVAPGNACFGVPGRVRINLGLRPKQGHRRFPCWHRRSRSFIEGQPPAGWQGNDELATGAIVGRSEAAAARESALTIETRESRTMQRTIDLPITVIATDRAGMESGLDEAVAVARTRALHEGRQGILVTRHDYYAFTVGLSDDVPFGLTREYQNW